MAEATLNPVKKDPDSDDDDDVPLAFKKPKSDDGEPLLIAPSKMKKEAVKKEPKQEAETDHDDSEDDGPISLASLKKRKTKIPNGDISKVSKEEKPLKKKIKEDVIKKKKKKMTNGKGAKVEDGKKVRKVYSLPGQKHDPPEERDPLRIFYETLYQQVPTSEMAAIWMMEWGLLPEKIAAVVYAKKQKSKPQNIKSPVKVVSASKTVKVSAKKPKVELKESPAKFTSKPTKKRKANNGSSDEEDDDDFILPLNKAKKPKLSN